MLHGTGRVFPSNIVTIRLSHHVGIIALTAIGNQCLIHLVHLIIFLLGGKLIGHFLEHSITLCVLTKGIIIDSLGVKQVVLYILVTGLTSKTFQYLELILSTFALAELHIHLQTFLRHQIMRGSLLTGRLFTGVDGVISTVQQVEGFLIEVLLIIQSRCLHGALYTLTYLSFIVIVIESMDIQRACAGNILFRVHSLRTLL